MSKTFHPQESVYNLIPKEESEIKKPPRYVSKFREAVVLESKLAKDAKRSMGPAQVELPSPEKFLQKQSKKPKVPEKTERSENVHKTCTCTVRKPPVPARTDNPVMGIHTKRDYLRTTVTVPTKPKPICVDNNKGHKQLLENSGLVPKYVMKRDYGEIPAYLQQRNEAKQRAQEEYERSEREQRAQEAKQYLSDEERQAVLKDLKKKWDALHREYQGLTLIIDTLSKKAYKTQLEEAMSQLEKDIDLFQNFKTIYIPQN